MSSDTITITDLAAWGDQRLECAYCGTEVSGRRGLITHHSQKHSDDAEYRAHPAPTGDEDSACCEADVERTAATGRRFCAYCGRILEDNRVDADGHGPDSDDWDAP